jgi:hypothetical protein
MGSIALSARGLFDTTLALADVAVNLACAVASRAIDQALSKKALL